MAEALNPQPSLPDAEDDGYSKGVSQARLVDLTAQATLKYSIKDYSAAAELYSEATELQAELNGEMSSKNADLLYAYGRCLYHVAVSNSDVLGSKVAGEQQGNGAKKSKSKTTNGESSAGGASDAQDRIAEEVVTQVVEDEDCVKDEKAGGESANDKPFFQFTGDENFDDSGNDEDGEDEDANGAEVEDEEDDFVNAYEVLDLARILLLRRLGETQVTDGKGKATEESEDVKQIKERLADTHDLQAEISLEGERFPNAVEDLKASLALKQDLFPKDSSLIAEAHYKLSLALEFSSVTQQKGEDGEADVGKEAHVDEAMREEAAQEMEAAIESCRLRIQKEEANLTSGVASTANSGNSKVTKESIDDVKDMVADMEQRLVELRQPPVSINDPTGTGAIDGTNPLSGILGSILGESPAAQKARIEEATKGAHDLTNLVKRKKPTSDGRQDTVRTGTVNGNGKRKVESNDEEKETGTGKKAKVEDAVGD
ncbi:MAG: hypothetical protein M1830_010684 [Pleopsidium flavum]|nr:MAG: hypothetical protein M1830_010684 [Pleopsidium flavum]